MLLSTSGMAKWTRGLAADPRVTLIENLNARDLADAHLGGRTIGAVVADLSFISLKLALPPALDLAAPGAWGVFLAKPQFEVGRKALGKGGIVRDPEIARQAADGIAAWLESGATLARHRRAPLAHRRRLGQPRVPDRRSESRSDEWLISSRSRCLAIAATESRVGRTVRFTSPSRSPANACASSAMASGRA